MSSTVRTNTGPAATRQATCNMLQHNSATLPQVREIQELSWAGPESSFSSSCRTRFWSGGPSLHAHEVARRSVWRICSVTIADLKWPNLERRTRRLVHVFVNSVESSNVSHETSTCPKARVNTLVTTWATRPHSATAAVSCRNGAKRELARKVASWQVWTSTDQSQPSAPLAIDTRALDSSCARISLRTLIAHLTSVRTLEVHGVLGL